MSAEDEPIEMPFTESEFVADVRANGFLAKSIELAIPAYVVQHKAWFEHAERFNCAAQQAFNCRDNVIVGLSTHSAKAIASRAMIRSMNAYQAAIILLRRGMASEADTLIRGLYETAFWLGFLLKDEAAAIRAIVVDELQSQNSLFAYYLELLRSGQRHGRQQDIADLEARIAENRENLSGARALGPKDLAKKSGLYQHYEAYKKISASAAHTSLHSLHKHLKMTSPGTYEGHIIGPDMEGTGVSLQLACTAFGLVVAHFGTITGPGDNDHVLQDLLIATDMMRAVAE